jgi:hypothetical protein
MIVHSKSGRYGEDEYIICPRPPVSVEELRQRMLQRAKVVPGSYAYRLIDELHAAIFVQSLDLKAEYEAYFAREYRSFDEYLRRRERLPAAVVAALTREFDASSGMYRFQPSYSFLSDTYGLDFLTQLVEDSPEGEAS